MAKNTGSTRRVNSNNAGASRSKRSFIDLSLIESIKSQMTDDAVDRLKDAMGKLYENGDHVALYLRSKILDSFTMDGKKKAAAEASLYYSLPTTGNSSQVSAIKKSVLNSIDDYIVSNPSIGRHFPEDIEDLSIKNGVARIFTTVKGYSNSGNRSRNEYTHSSSSSSGGVLYLPKKHSNPDQVLSNIVISESIRKGVRVKKVIIEKLYD